MFLKCYQTKLQSVLWLDLNFIKIKVKDIIAKLEPRKSHKTVRNVWKVSICNMFASIPIVYGSFFPATAKVCWKCVFGFFGSIVMGPSWIWIFMKINIFLFEHLKSQDFLDPDFSDPHTCVRKIWIQKILALQMLKYKYIYFHKDPNSGRTHNNGSKNPENTFQQTLAVAGKNGPYVTLLVC